MTALANKSGAVNLSQGFPDFDPDASLLEYVTKAMMEHKNQYAAMPGALTLRNALSLKYQHFFNVPVDPDLNVTITPGGTAALFTAIATVVNGGDEVLVFDPAYDSYAPSVEILGGRVVRSPLQLPSYTPDWQHVRSVVTDRTKLIIINSPHNPSGTMWSRADYSELAVLCEELDCFVLADEVYDLITYERNHTSVLSLPALKDRCFVVCSFGKLVHATGWKVGACIANTELTQEFRKLHQFINFSVNTPMQEALGAYLETLKPLETLAPFLQIKRDRFAQALKTSLWNIRPCHGTYFQLLDYSAFWNGSDMDLAQLLVSEFKVACIPLSPFVSNGNSDTAVRLCFAKQEGVLDLAAERLTKAAAALASR